MFCCDFSHFKHGCIYGAATSLLSGCFIFHPGPQTLNSALFQLVIYTEAAFPVLKNNKQRLILLFVWATQIFNKVYVYYALDQLERASNIHQVLCGWK